MSDSGRRRVVDGAAFGVYEDDEPERRAPRAALAVLAVATVVVGLLVWRAVGTEAELEVPAGERAAPTTSPAAPAAAPTVEQLQLLLPAGVDGCAPPPDAPAGGPDRAVLRCSGPGAPEVIDFSLYPSVEARDDAFDFLAAALEVPDDGTECALGRPGRHDYVGVQQVGQLACQSVGGRTDLLWTSDAGALLAVATGEGSYAEQYRWWAGLVDRADGAFPIGEEQALLDQLPGSLLDDCDRDPDLRLASGGAVAVTCRPERSPAAAVSWIAFDADEAVGRWFSGRRERLSEAVVAEHPDACRADRFGRPELLGGTGGGPAPEAGEADYDVSGTSGSVLCHRDQSGRSVVVWARDRGRLGSVAVGADGVAVPELLSWWERGGYLP